MRVFLVSFSATRPEADIVVIGRYDDFQNVNSAGELRSPLLGVMLLGAAVCEYVKTSTYFDASTTRSPKQNKNCYKNSSNQQEFHRRLF